MYAMKLLDVCVSFRSGKVGLSKVDDCDLVSAGTLASRAAPGRLLSAVFVLLVGGCSPPVVLRMCVHAVPVRCVADQLLHVQCR